MLGGRYILDGKTPVRCDDPLQWAQWCVENEPSHRVLLDVLTGGVTVSTVFLGVDCGWDMEMGPMLFETMVFGGALDEEQERYRTWDEAEAGHKRMVERAKKGGN